MNNAAENRRKKALLIVNPCAGKNRTRSDLGEIVNAFPRIKSAALYTVLKS